MRKLLVMLLFVCFSFYLVSAQFDENDFDFNGVQESFNNASTSSEGQIHVNSFFATILNIQQDTSIQELAISICLFILMFLVIREALQFMPFLNSGWIMFFSALIITALASLGGAVGIMKESILDIFNSVQFFNEHPILKFFLVLVALVIAYILASSLFGLIRRKMKLENASQNADNFARGSKIAGIFAKAGEDLAKK